ncbi:hypothetical protein O4328_43575 [Rhodococcus opacus]|uniref:Uncharacterized protein n=1 Tax=Rhodococcus opacus TaxID=37919 RepID=A0AAX3YNY3_RHOOP|nr:hypothetical protein [Rhodococcus opacus]MCZ4590422.1 hypothetical protein [Rhodococcus opacus]WLF51252.1 hypothetical protein Q5707_38465 [Rhodococcus opacus]
MPTTASRPANGVARFVAYDRNPVRIGNPEDGTAISVRAETFVEEYASIAIKEFAEKSNGDFDTVYVKFDAASTGAQGMKHDFGASAEPGGALAERLRKAYETGTPVYVAIETRRRKHVENKRDEPIDPRMPIHTLRGASGESLSGQPQATKANCVKVIVAAGSVDDPTDTAIASDKDLRSDISEWTQLRGNKLGDLPPEGWRCLVADGKRTGGITPDGPKSGSADVDAIAEAVAGKIAGTKGAPARSGQPAANSGVRGRPGLVAEAKAWESVNSDGRPNMGSYLAAKLRATHQSAVYLFQDAVTAVEESEQPELTEETSLEHVWQLTELLLWLADQVQKSVVGAINRNEASHKEAGQWVQQIISTRYPYAVEHITDDDARREWSLLVGKAAAEDFSRTQRMMADYLGIDLQPAAETRPQQEQEQQQSAGRGEATTSQPTAQQRQDQVRGTASAQQQLPPEQRSPRPLTAGEDPDAVTAWKKLADACGMGEYIDQLRFILKATFGISQGLLGEIEATAFTRQVDQWAANPTDFREQAGHAFNNDPENRKAS